MDVLLKTAVSLQRLGRVAEALAVADRFLDARPEHAMAWNFRGNLQLGLGRTAEALASYERALALRADYPEARHNRGVALIETARYAEAEPEFRRLLLLKPGSAGAQHALGICLAFQGKHSEALEAFDQAVAAGSSDAAVYKARARALQNLKRPEEALASYDRALVLGEDAECLAGRGMVLLSLQRDVDALSNFARALSFSRGDPNAWLGQAIALVRLDRPEEAIASFDQALHLRPGERDGLYNRANAFALLKRYEEAARDCESLLQLDPEYPYALGLLLHCRLYACDWRDFSHLRRKAEEAVKSGRRAIHPFLHLAISDSPQSNLRAAEIFAAELYPDAPERLWRGEPYRHDRIRIAYLSADFCRHATAFLMVGVFEQHDRAKFETIAISYGPDDGSDMRARLESAFDSFLDLRTLSDREIAQKLRKLEIDIAVDLKGYTGGARPGILAARPAPIQLHYLGYPGSLGADYVDYLVGDEIIIAAGERNNFREQIVCLPGCYQCNDLTRSAPSSAPSRSLNGLPEAGFVFCCFNSSFKINPDIFDIWMRLLKAIPGSVLWLLASNAVSAANLRQEARNRGVAPERLVFGGLVPRDEHLARLKLADLALDTFPYGAHTTASDAVRAGVPLLTIRGESFAARVAASILTSACLPGMIASSHADYEIRAVALARDAAALSAIREKLQANRRASVLFDTVLFTRHLESAYMTMYERANRGFPPAGFAVEPIPDA